MEDYTYDPTEYMKPAFRDKADISAEDLERKKQEQLRKNDIIDILSTSAGQRFFKDMMISGGVFTEKIATNSTVYINSAYRAFALMYYNLACEANPNFKMLLSPPYEEMPYEVRQKPQKAQN